MTRNKSDVTRNVSADGLRITEVTEIHDLTHLGILRSVSLLDLAYCDALKFDHAVKGNKCMRNRTVSFGPHQDNIWTVSGAGFERILEQVERGRISRAIIGTDKVAKATTTQDNPYLALPPAEIAKKANELLFGNYGSQLDEYLQRDPRHVRYVLAGKRPLPNAWVEVLISLANLRKTSLTQAVETKTTKTRKHLASMAELISPSGPIFFLRDLGTTIYFGRKVMSASEGEPSPTSRMGQEVAMLHTKVIEIARERITNLNFVIEALQTLLSKS